MYEITRTHEIQAGHRVYGHEGKCKFIHGHRYIFEITIKSESELDHLGRVIDFSVIKTLLCDWLDDHWDHKLLLYRDDPIVGIFRNYGPNDFGVVVLPCNPTVENLAAYFAEDIVPGLLYGLDVKLSKLTIWETSKCSATYYVKEKNESSTRAGRRNMVETK